MFFGDYKKKVGKNVKNCKQFKNLFFFFSKLFKVKYNVFFKFKFLYSINLNTKPQRHKNIKKVRPK